MQHAAPAHPHMSPSRYLLVYLFVCYCSLAFAKHSMRPSVLPQRLRRRRYSDSERAAAQAEGTVEKAATAAVGAGAGAGALVAWPASKRQRLQCDASSRVF